MKIENKPKKSDGSDKMILNVSEKLTPFGTTTAEAIQNVEDKLDFKFPNSYRQFLLSANGGISAHGQLGLYVKDIDDTIIIDCFFGIDLKEDNKNNDLMTYMDMLSDDILPDSILIADTIQQGFIVLICGGNDKGVYYWDDSYVYEQSDDETNMYWIAENFEEFLSLLSTSVDIE